MTNPYDQGFDRRKASRDHPEHSILVEHYVTQAAGAFWLQNKARIVSTLVNAEYLLGQVSKTGPAAAAALEIQRLREDIRRA